MILIKQYGFLLSILFSWSLSSCNAGKNDNNNDLVQLQITPNQCEEPWASAKGDTNKDKVYAYLNTLGIKTLAYKETNRDIMACAACGCPGLTIFTLQIDQKHKESLLKRGFSEVTAK